MKYKLIVRPEAEAELEEAFAWYEQQVAGLGSHFLLAVDAIINSIQRNPLQYPVVYKGVRRALTRRFPYQVFFVVKDMQISIIAIFHGMRNPTIWQSRN
ncbi:type II toxin-antitoxin system RelE/ParE family toxin [Planctomycetota bacterium]